MTLAKSLLLSGPEIFHLYDKGLAIQIFMAHLGALGAGAETLLWEAEEPGTA